MKDNKKVLMIVAAVVGVIVLCLACSGIGFVALAASTPSDKKVCEHFVDIAKEEFEKSAGDEDPYGNVNFGELFNVDDCIESLEKEDLSREARKCVMDADTIRDLEKCEDWDL